MSDSNYSIQVIERIACLLDALANRSGATPLKDLAAKTGLHPSTTHRILNDLAQYRIIERSQPGCRHRAALRLVVECGLNVRNAECLFIADGLPEQWDVRNVVALAVES